MGGARRRALRRVRAHDGERDSRGGRWCEFRSLYSLSSLSLHSRFWAEATRAARARSFTRSLTPLPALWARALLSPLADTRKTRTQPALPVPSPHSPTTSSPSDRKRARQTGAHQQAGSSTTSMGKDYYAVLGVSKSASDDELKKGEAAG